MSDNDNEQLSSLDIIDLMECLPHRYPFLLIDKIIEYRGDEFAIGVKNVTFNEPHFMGHFPGNPVMPGVLIVEGMAQTAGAICSNAQPKSARSSVLFMSIDGAKFRKPVRPGDVIEYHITKLKQKRDVYKYSGLAFVDGVKVAEAVFVAMITHEKDEA
jgi:3-hydroxyacyl-[acyl-carrier-protein] dehydratase